jgi:nucleotidyltransferase substrate binding protein (TIGR01987 family)
MTEDTLWQHCFHNYKNALGYLTDAIELGQQRSLSKLEKQGLIHGFEFTHELGWNVLKDYLESKGYTGLIGSRDATSTAFKNQLIADGDAWMDMIKARNQSSHTYNLDVAESIAQDILLRFYPAFVELVTTFSQLKNNQS